MRLKRLAVALLGAVLVVTSLGLAPVQALAATRGKVVSSKGMVYDYVYGIRGGYTLAGNRSSNGSSTQYVLDTKGNVKLKLEGKTVQYPGRDFSVGGFLIATTLREFERGSFDLCDISSGERVVKDAQEISFTADGKHALVVKDGQVGLWSLAQRKYVQTMKVVSTADAGQGKGWGFNYSAPSGFSIWKVEGKGTDNVQYPVKYYKYEGDKFVETKDRPQYFSDSNKPAGTLQDGTKLAVYFNKLYKQGDKKQSPVYIGKYQLSTGRADDDHTYNDDATGNAQRASEDFYYAVDPSTGKYGAVSSKGEVLIPFEYDGISDLGESSTSLILVKKGNAWYYYDTSEKSPFPDVKPGDEDNHASDVLWLAGQKITTGFPDGTFRGLDSVARADMAAFLYRLAGSPKYEPSAKAKAMFSDVSDSTPHAKEIRWLADMGISQGWKVGSSSEFRPYGTVARQDMAAFLHRLADKLGKEGSGSEKVTFSDVRSGDEGNHASDVEWLAGNGVTKGWKVGSRYEFRGMQPVARQDMAAFLRRLDSNVLK